MTLSQNKVVACSSQFSKDWNQQTEQLKKIEAVLLSLPNIEDCAVLIRSTEQGELELVAYVVCSEPVSLDRIFPQIQTKLPLVLIPKTYISVSAIPLTSEGEVDQEILTNLAVLDQALTQRWEEQLKQQPELNEIAVLIQEQIPSVSPLHLSDILPDRKATPVLTSPQIPFNQSNSAIASIPPTSKPLALAEGEILLEKPNAAQNLAESLKQTAKQVLGNKILYLQDNGEEIWQSYAELLDRAERILAGLRKQGLKPQDRVIIQLDQNQDILSVFWGCILGGIVPVIMAVPPTYSAANNDLEKLCHVWKLLDQPVILTRKSQADAISSLSNWLPLSISQVIFIDPFQYNEPDSNHHPSQPDDLAFFNLTSGSTGVPKSIMLTHRNILSRARGTNQLCQYSPNEVILNWLPFDHIGSISDWHLRCVELGCTLIYASKEYVLGNPLNWLNLIDDYRITQSWAPNFAYTLINDALKSEAHQNWDLSSLNTLLTAGEAVSSKTVEIFSQNLSLYGLKKTAIRPAFGMAEMGSGITYFLPTEQEPVKVKCVDRFSLGGSLISVPNDHPHALNFTSLGPVIPGVSIRIVDDQNQLLPEETIGHLHVKGAPVSPGYYKNPEVNQQVFLEQGWFDTGDLGFISDGDLFITGRGKETIIINGANYYNGEIESVVEELDGVEVSYTAACAVRPIGSETEKLAIFFNTSIQSENRLTELLKSIQGHLTKKVGVKPDYLIPVSPAEIPKTAIGKIQRKQLVKQFEQGEFDDRIKHLDILLENSQTLPDWFYRKVWKPKQIRHQSFVPKTGLAIVFLDSLGLGHYLVEQYKQYHRPFIRVQMGDYFAKVEKDLYVINPTQPQHYQQLLELITQDHRPITDIVHLWSYDQYTPEMNRWSGLEYYLEVSVYSWLFLVQALAKTQVDRHSVRLLTVANFAQATSELDLVCSERSVILGLIKAGIQELPWLNASHLDLPLQSLEQNVNWIWQELHNLTPDVEVAYRNEQRLIPRLEKVNWTEEPVQPLPFKPQGLYLISGGLGGIATEVAEYLLKHYQAKLLLVGRTALPPEETWDQLIKNQEAIAEKLKTLIHLQKLGQVRYQAVDICHLNELQAIVQQAQFDWGHQLDGVIHLAGTYQERFLLDETKETLESVLNPKGLGTRALYSLLQNSENAIFVHFSSLASIFGGAMIGAYAAANQFLDTFSHYQRHYGSVRSYCLNWSLWDGIGMSRNAESKVVLRSKGYYSIPLKQGLNSLLVGLHHNANQLLVGLDGSNRNIRRFIEEENKQIQTLNAYYTLDDEQMISPEELSTLVVCDRFGTLSSCRFHQLEKMPLTATGEIDQEQLIAFTRGTQTKQIPPRTELEKQLAEIWQAVLGLDRVGIHDNFFDLGGTSLLSVRLFAEIEDKLGKKFPLATLFKAATIAELSQRFDPVEPSESLDSLVIIKSGGSLQPLFLVHDADGETLLYRNLAYLLESERPVYGLRPYGIENYPALHTRISEMVDYYIQQIRTVQPQGPYLMGGLCAGGVLAFEIACQLQAQGETIELVALFDTMDVQAPCLRNQLITAQRAERLQALLAENRKKSVLQQGMTLFNQVRSKVINLITYEINKNLQTYQTKIKFQLLRFYQDKNLSLPQFLQNIAPRTVYKFAQSEYQPSLYQGKLVLFRATEKLEMEDPNIDDEPSMNLTSDPLFGWGQRATDGVEVWDVPGGHSSMLQDPQVQVLAEKLSSYLQK